MFSEELINYDMKKSIKNTLKKMGFPEKKINPRIIKLFYIYFYHEEVHQFKNGKMKLDTENENIFGHRANSKATNNGNVIQNIFDTDLNWNIIKLFSKANIINVIHPKLLDEINIYIKSIIFNTTQIKRLFNEHLILSSNYDEFKFLSINHNSYESFFNIEFDLFFKKYNKKLYNYKFPFFSLNRKLHDFNEIYLNIKNIYDHFDGIYFKLLGSINLLEKTLKKHNLCIFNFSERNLIMDSFTEILFSVCNSMNRESVLTKSNFTEDFYELAKSYIKSGEIKKSNETKGPSGIKESSENNDDEILLKLLYANKFNNIYINSRNRQTILINPDFLVDFGQMLRSHIKPNRTKESFENNDNEILLNFLYAYQFNKLYSNSNEILKSLLLSYNSPLESEIPKKINFAQTIKIEEKNFKDCDFFKKYTKNELFQYVSNEPINNPNYKDGTKYKKFKSSIERLEKFLKLSPQNQSDLDLRSYSFVYKELIETKDKYNDKAIPTLVHDCIEQKADQNTLNYLFERLGRAIFMSNNSFKEYQNKMKIKLKLREIMTSNSNYNPETIKEIFMSVLKIYEIHTSKIIFKYWYAKPTNNMLKREFPYK